MSAAAASTDADRARASAALASLVFALGVGAGLAQLRVVTFDGLLEYIRDARVLAEGGLAAYRHAVHPVGYPSTLAVVAHLTGGSLFAASRLVSWLAGLAVLPLVTVVARRAFGGPVAALAPWAVIAGSALVAHTLEPSSTVPAAALQLASIALVVSGPDSPRRLAAAGATVALAWLVRYPSILVFAATALWLVARLRREPRRLALALAAYVVPFFVLASPQLALNVRHGLDPFIANNAGYILRAERGHFAADQTIVSMLILEGGRAAAFWAKNLTLFVVFNAPLIAALAWVARRERTAPVGYLTTVVVVQQLVLPLTNFNPKFYLLDRWLLLGFALRAVVLAAPRLGEAWRRRTPLTGGAVARAAGAGLAAALVAPLVAGYVAFRAVEVRSMLGADDVGAGHRAITDLLHAHGYTAPGELLGCTNVHYDLRALDEDRVVYYREATVRLGSIPRFTSGVALEGFLREHGLRFVLYDAEDRANCPDLAFLFEPEALPDTLEPLWIDDFYNQTDRLALYRLGEPPPAPLTPAERRARWQAVRVPSLKGLFDDWSDRLGRPP